MIPIVDPDGDNEDDRQDTDSMWEKDWYSFSAEQVEPDEIEAQIAEDISPRPESRRDPIIDNTPPGLVVNRDGGALPPSEHLAVRDDDDLPPSASQAGTTTSTIFRSTGMDQMKALKAEIAQHRVNQLALQRELKESQKGMADDMEERMVRCLASHATSAGTLMNNNLSAIPEVPEPEETPPRETGGQQNEARNVALQRFLKETARSASHH